MENTDTTNIRKTQPPTRILVIGAGYAGLLFTMRLAGKVARQNVHISLVNEADTFTERLRLHFATNQAVQWRSIPQMLHKTSVQFIQGRVTSIDAEQHQVVIMDQQQTHQQAYDYLCRYPKAIAHWLSTGYSGRGDVFSDESAGRRCHFLE